MDGELHDSDRIHRLERRVANLEARIRDLEAGAGLAASEAAPVSPALMAATPPPPPAPVQDEVAAAWGSLSRVYGLERRAPQVGGAIPGWDPDGRAAARRQRSSATAQQPEQLASPGWGPSAGGSPLAEPTAPSSFSFDLKDLEERFAGRALAWIGGAALIGAAVFFLSLAFSRGWIGEELRVAIGLVAGTAALVGGAVMFDRKNPLLGNVLVAVGLGVVSIALFAATRGYELVAPEFGLLGAFLAAVAAAVIAIRYDAKEVAAFGLLAALGAPPVLGASPNMLTLLFVAVTLVGTTAIAVFRTWPYLPPLAFVLAAPQLASYLAGGVGATEGLIAVIGFWAVNVTAAAGEEWRIHRDQLKPTSATLVLANATFALWGGYTVLTGSSNAQWIGTYIGLLSVAHLLLGGWFLRRQGLQHLFGNLVAGTGLALVAIAAFVQLGAPVVPLAWAAEAVALAWLAVRRAHKWAALAALVLGGLAIGHIFMVEYELSKIADGYRYLPVPWLHAEGASVLSVVAALGLAALLVPVRWIRSALVGIGILLAEYASMFEVAGTALMATLVLLALLALVLERAITARGTRPDLAAVGAASPSFPYAATAGAVAVLHAVGFVMAAEFPARPVDPAAVPYATQATVSLLILLAGLVAAGRLLPERGVRSVLGAIGILVIGWTELMQLVNLPLYAAMAVMLPAAVVLERGLARLGDRPAEAPIRLASLAGVASPIAGAVVWVSAIPLAAGTYLPPLLSGARGLPLPPFTDETAAAGAALVGAALAAARWTLSDTARRGLLLGAIAVAAGVVPLQVLADLIVPLWLVLAGLAMIAGGRAALVKGIGTGVAAQLAIGAVLLAFGVVAPAERLWVQGGEGWAPPPLLPAWVLSLASVAVALALAARRGILGRRAVWLAVAAAATGVYLVSVGVVDVFQRQVGGAIAAEELAKQAQVAMSVVWTVIGVAALAWGLAKGRVLARHTGLGLLGIATAKVILVDMASMDVAYRAAVLFGLGVLLILAAGLFTRLRGPRAGDGGAHAAGPVG